MAFTSYLISRFDFTHENSFFREFSERLRSLFESRDGKHILIGNISCQGHKIDAIFIRSGQITIIDFKDYGGRLEFSENNPWKIFAQDNSLVFVAGGAQGRNPFQQVSAYRYSLIRYLSDNEKTILSVNRNNIRWDHISTLVLFQKDIVFNNDQIPSSIQRYFSVSDRANAYNTIEDRNSKQLQLNDNEIQFLLEILDVRAENVYNPAIEPITNSTIVAPNSPQRLAHLRRFIKGNDDPSQFKRVINYYRALLEIERFKEPSAGVLYNYPIDWNNNAETIAIELLANPKFREVFLVNRQERFPKNIFIGINVSIEGNTVPLFHYIILNSDIDNIDRISFKTNLLDLYPKSLAEFELTEDIIEELITCVNKVDTFQEKLQAVRDYLDVAAELTTAISIGLSNESLFTAQLLAELKRLSQRDEINFPDNIRSFILNKDFATGKEDFKFQPFLKVTSLNKSQELAIKLSFSQPLTVITGPPGTGKSQVVINLIANAIANNQTILFASKNNKAIDSVKDRFDEINEEKYLLRFGSADDLTANTIPKIQQFINYIKAKKYLTNIKTVNKQKEILSEKFKRIEHLKNLIDSIPILAHEIELQQKKLEELKLNFTSWLNSLDSEIKLLFIDQRKTIKIDLNIINAKIVKLEKARSGFFNKIYFNLFHKSKITREVINLNSSLDESVYQYVSSIHPYIDHTKNIIDSLHDNCNFILELQKLIAELQKENKKRENEIKSLHASLAENQRNHQQLTDSIGEFKSEIVMIETAIPNLSINLLNTITDYRLSNTNIPAIQIFKDFIPANKLFKDEELLKFQMACQNFLKDFNAVCVTSLSVRNSFSLKEQLFDILVIDEASQCDIASALPLIYRAKKVVIIGDPLQLKHITSVKQYEEDYVINEYSLGALQLKYTSQSLFDFATGIANKSKFESVFLDEHFRCHPDIISYSKLHFYQEKLGQELKIMTANDQFIIQPAGLKWENTIGAVSDNTNINSNEVQKSILLAQELAQQYPEASIGITTPFKDQYKAIFNALPHHLKERIKVDTVHKFQGDEKDIMIFSLVVSPNCKPSLCNFINLYAPYLLNVAITRARNRLYIVGDQRFCLGLKTQTTKSLLCRLAEYATNVEKPLN